MRNRILRDLHVINQWSSYFSYGVTIRCPLQSRLLKTTGYGLANSRLIYSPASCTPIPAAFKNDSIYVSSRRSSQMASHSRLGEAKLESDVQDLECTYETLFSSRDTIPSDKDAEDFLEKCMNIAQSLNRDASSLTSSRTGAASVLLSLDNTESDQANCVASSETERMINVISDLAYSFITQPNIFISPKLLKMYVAVQATLGRPDTLPEALHLYSHKPVPLRNTFPVRHVKPNPNLFKNAIPLDVSKAALEVAIKAKKLVVAIDIIEKAYTTKAFKTSKFVRQALLPASLLAITPFATYTLASLLSSWQSSMDANLARNVAFMGIMAYIGLTGTVGFVAISTSNDQMDRVTWAPGVPLRQRWIREEERAAIDQVAGAWGFRESWRRGEEDGEEWDLIKEWVSRRAMILDRVELMEGMN